MAFRAPAVSRQRRPRSGATWYDVFVLLMRPVFLRRSPGGEGTPGFLRGRGQGRHPRNPGGEPEQYTVDIQGE